MPDNLPMEGADILQRLQDQEEETALLKKSMISAVEAIEGILLQLDRIITLLD